MRGKILIFGKGFIGNRIREYLKCDISGRRIFSYRDAQKEIKRFKPDVIINCIGHTGRNVDDCEKDIDKTLLANTFVPVILAEAALRNNIRFVHISSGCIYHYDYHKDHPVPESKAPDFFDLFYSRSKIYAEEALDVLSQAYPILILRLRIPLDGRPHPRNILTKLLKYKKIIDIPNSITYLPDFLKALKHLIKIRANGIYNIANKGKLRYPELLEAYKKYMPRCKYETTDNAGLRLLRTNLLLSGRKLSNSGFLMPNIHEVLEECVQEYLKY